MGLPLETVIIRLLGACRGGRGENGSAHVLKSLVLHLDRTPPTASDTQPSLASLLASRAREGKVGVTVGISGSL
jgi:hypothetical protein